MYKIFTILLLILISCFKFQNSEEYNNKQIKKPGFSFLGKYSRSFHRHDEKLILSKDKFCLYQIYNMGISYQTDTGQFVGNLVVKYNGDIKYMENKMQLLVLNKEEGIITDELDTIIVKKNEIVQKENSSIYYPILWNDYIFLISELNIFGKNEVANFAEIFKAPKLPINGYSEIFQKKMNDTTFSKNPIIPKDIEHYFNQSIK